MSYKPVNKDNTCHFPNCNLSFSTPEELQQHMRDKKHVMAIAYFKGVGPQCTKEDLFKAFGPYKPQEVRIWSHVYKGGCRKGSVCFNTLGNMYKAIEKGKYSVHGSLVFLSKKPFTEDEDVKGDPSSTEGICQGHIRGIDRNTTEDDIRKAFKDIKYNDVRVITRDVKGKQETYTYAILEFTDESEFEKAQKIHYLNGKYINLERRRSIERRDTNQSYEPLTVHIGRIPPGIKASVLRKAFEGINIENIEIKSRGRGDDGFFTFAIVKLKTEKDYQAALKVNKLADGTAIAVNKKIDYRRKMEKEEELKEEEEEDNDDDDEEEEDDENDSSDDDEEKDDDDDDGNSEKDTKTRTSTIPTQKSQMTISTHQSKSQPQPKSQPRSQSKNQPQSQLQSQPKSQQKVQLQSNPKSQPQIKPQQPQIKPQSQPKLKSQTPQQKSQPQLQSQLQSQPQSKSQHQIQPKPQQKSQSQQKPQLQSQSSQKSQSLLLPVSPQPTTSLPVLTTHQNPSIKKDADEKTKEILSQIRKPELTSLLSKISPEDATTDINFILSNNGRAFIKKLVENELKEKESNSKKRTRMEKPMGKDSESKEEKKKEEEEEDIRPTIWISDINDNFATYSQPPDENAPQVTDDDYMLYETFNTSKRSVLEYGFSDDEVIKFRLKHNETTPTYLTGDETITVYRSGNKIVRELPPRMYLVVVSIFSEDVNEENAKDLVEYGGSDYKAYRLYTNYETGERTLEIYYTSRLKAMKAVETFTDITVNSRPVKAMMP